ncbi:MAG: radical SAM protein [Bacteroidetes bacterium GWB2_41_8]|nr:MAG: radical SAM protein [Bacteroidetes bacterium GWB2_41_8]
MNQPFIFDIKRYAINDGPGIRIVIFMKGCNLNCAWCHNPESISTETERMYAPSKCIRCGTCVIACPEKAITLTSEGIITETERCNISGCCAEVCPTKAIELSGKSMSVAEIMNEIEKERVFFDQSGGGVTFSGGEPLLQSKFLIELLDECGKRGIHRAVDTAGLANTEIIQAVAKRTDLFLYDLKLMDSERHRKWVGVSNEKILENLKLLSETGEQIIIRIPLIGRVNDDAENMHATARFVASLSGEKKEVNLLPYHKIAHTKYQKLGRPEDFQLLEEPTKDAQLQALNIFQEYGIVASIGG